MDPKTLGRAAKAIRNAKGMTQMEFAKKAKLSQTQISQFEGGIKIPRRRHQLIWQKAMGVDLHVLYLLAMYYESIREDVRRKLRNTIKLMEPELPLFKKPKEFA